MATRNYNISDARKNSAVKNNNTMRVQFEEHSNIGLMAFATYVATTFDGTTALVECGKDVTFGKEERVILCSGNNGTLARVGVVSTCGKFAMRNGKTIALGTHGALSIVDAGNVGEFVAALQKGAHGAKAHGFKVDKDGRTLYGVGFGADGWQAKAGVYCSLAWKSTNGKLVFVDMETKKNDYNGEVLGAHLCADTDAMKAGAESVFAFAGKTVKATQSGGKKAKALAKGKRK